jgi:broad specificity phosphatase PhoE
MTDPDMTDIRQRSYDAFLQHLAESSTSHTSQAPNWPAPAAVASSCSWRKSAVAPLGAARSTTPAGFATIALIEANGMRELWLVRHGETEWSRSGQHTGRTDIPLTEAGRHSAAALGRYLEPRPFALVLASPLQRARETCRLAGYENALIDPNLREWDYGDYEGRTTSEIQADRPGWSLWTAGAPNGETAAGVAVRAEAVIARALGAADAGDVLIFAHGHILRVLAARWLALPPEDGRLFALGTAAVSTLGYERETRVISRWNLSLSA